MVITTDDHQLPPDWLAWLDAYIANSPEVDFFYGETTPPANKRAGALARAWSRAELQSRLIRGRTVLLARRSGIGHVGPLPSLTGAAGHQSR